MAAAVENRLQGTREGLWDQLGAIGMSEDPYSSGGGRRGGWIPTTLGNEAREDRISYWIGFGV